jgi:hypothetical protein
MDCNFRPPPRASKRARSVTTVAAVLSMRLSMTSIVALARQYRTAAVRLATQPAAVVARQRPRVLVRFNLKTAVDGRKTPQVAVEIEQFGRRSLTDLELLRSCENRPESRANTRSALFGSHDNCGF